MSAASPAPAAVLASPRLHVGHDLLPADFEEDRDHLVYRMAAGYSAILTDKADNFKLWHNASRAFVETIQSRYRALGLEAAPWAEAHLWSRIDLPCPGNKPLEHLRLLQALLTNFHAPFFGQYAYRIATGGNVHLQWVGPTGMGKSSCAVAVMHDTHPIQPERLVDYLCFDTAELPDKLKGKLPGEWVHLDENLAAAGEGSRTTGALLGNMEDTIRASQVSLSTSSPELEATATTQAQAEVILWNPRKRWSLFLVWVKGVPMGVVGLPWMPDVHFAVYSPWKAGNVQRSIQAKFNDSGYLARMVAKCCQDRRFVAFILNAANKPKLKDFRAALSLFPPQLMAANAADRLSEFMHVLFYGWDRLKTNLLDWFGIEPTPAMQEIADKCYDE